MAVVCCVLCVWCCCRTSTMSLVSLSLVGGTATCRRSPLSFVADSYWLFGSVISRSEFFISNWICCTSTHETSVRVCAAAFGHIRKGTGSQLENKQTSIRLHRTWPLWLDYDCADKAVRTALQNQRFDSFDPLAGGKVSSHSNSSVLCQGNVTRKSQKDMSVAWDRWESPGNCQDVNKKTLQIKKGYYNMVVC